MGLLDKLKKLGLFNTESLVKIVVNNYNVDNSQKIEINDSTINPTIKSIDKQEREYKLPNAVEYDYVKPHIKKLYKKNISGFVRKDLALPEVGMLFSRQKRKELFKIFKGNIRHEHYNALISSFTIIEFEDQGDMKTAMELFENLIKRFHEDGRHIYNFCRSGLIEGFFYNELAFLIAQGYKGQTLSDKYKKVFDAYVEFYPYAVWVAPQMEFKDIVQEIRIRINIKDVTWLEIYFRGKEKMPLFDDIKMLIEKNETLKIDKVERYSIGNSPCVRLNIRKTSDFKVF